MRLIATPIFLLLASLLAIPLAASPSMAQQGLSEADQTDFQLFLKDHNYMDTVKMQLGRQSTIICDQGTVETAFRPNRFGFLKPPEFNPKRKLVAAMWMHSFTGQLCGQERQVNMLFLYKDKTLKSGLLLPGPTKATPVLQHDALPAAYAAAHLVKPDCERLFPVNTELLDDQPENPPLGWLERWTFQGCGATVNVRLHFYPDGEGGTFFSSTTEQQ